MRRLIEDLRDTIDYVLNDFVNLTNRRLYIAYIIIQEIGERIEKIDRQMDLFDYKGYGIRSIEDGIFVFMKIEDRQILPDNLLAVGENINGLTFMGLRETIEALKILPFYIENFARTLGGYCSEVKNINLEKYTYI